MNSEQGWHLCLCFQLDPMNGFPVGDVRVSVWDLKVSPQLKNVLLDQAIDSFIFLGGGFTLQEEE